ncbi:MAG: efflux transporter outer membrane subunit [Stenotrophobium sp.]
MARRRQAYRAGSRRMSRKNPMSNMRKLAGRSVVERVRWMRTRNLAAAGFMVLLAAGLMSSCAVGPDYQRPEFKIPAGYKEKAQDGWKPGQPQDTTNRGAWWVIYKDPVLDGLEQQVDISNQNLKAAEAAYRQSRTVVQAARASFFPVISLDAAASRAHSGGSGGVRVQNQYGLSAGASWEPDLWGRIRRTVESDVAGAQASAADLASARLSAQAQLATDYFELRVADELKRLLDGTVTAYTRSLAITQNQYAAGIVAKTDVITAETQLKSAQAQVINTGVQRAQLEHAIAVLTGKLPAEFSLEPATLSDSVPDIPPGVPSTLLERRPDIASAERQVAAANAQIGVAISAYFPDLTLSGSYGYQSSAISELLKAPSLVWSVGPQLAATLFDAGLRSAQVAGARAAYDQRVAVYRQTVLSGFQQVEDALAAQRLLAQQAAVQRSAVELAQQAEQLTLNQYKAGTVAYSSVVQAQVISLGNQQSALAIRQAQLAASVDLITALGGGWDVSQQPDTGVAGEAAPTAAKR